MSIAANVSNVIIYRNNNVKNSDLVYSLFTCSSDDHLQHSSAALPVAGNVKGQTASEMVGAKSTMTMQCLQQEPTDPLSMRDISSGIDLHDERTEEWSTLLQDQDEQLKLIINEDTNCNAEAEPVTVDSSSDSHLSSQPKQSQSSSVGTGMYL